MTVTPSGRGLRLAGWLLTPAVVWAASFAGGWVGSALGGQLGTAASGIAWLIGGSVVGGTAGLVIWVARLRRGARLARRSSPAVGGER